MRFSVALSEFQKVLQRVLPAIPAKSTLPVLEHLHFILRGSNLMIAGTDQELAITSNLSVMGEEDGAILVPAKRIAEIVKALSQEGTLEFSTDDKYQITLRTDYGQYTMKGMDAEEYPDMPDFSGEAKAHFRKEDLMRIANKVVFAVSHEEYRPAMTGVLFQFRGEQMNAVATDGYRLARLIVNNQNGGFPELEVIIPSRVVDLLKKIDSDVELSVSKSHAKFSIGDTTIVTRVIDERFPPYENVIPKDNDKEAILAQREVLSAIRRVAIFTNHSSRQIRLSLNGTAMNIRGEDEENGSRANENIPCDYNSEPLEIGFNHRYIEEALQNISGDDTTNNQVIMSFSSPTRAVLIRPNSEKDDLLMLVMPVRLT